MPHAWVTWILTLPLPFNLAESFIHFLHLLLTSLLAHKTMLLISCNFIPMMQHKCGLTDYGGLLDACIRTIMVYRCLEDQCADRDMLCLAHENKNT